MLYYDVFVIAGICEREIYASVFYVPFNKGNSGFEAESPGKNPILNASTFCGEQKYLGLDPWLPSHCSAAHPLDLLPLVLAFGSSQRPPVASRTDVCRENTGGLLTAALQAALGLCALPSFHVTSSLSLRLQSLTRPGVSLQPISVSPKIKSVLQQFCRN